MPSGPRFDPLTLIEVPASSSSHGSMGGPMGTPIGDLSALAKRIDDVQFIADSRHFEARTIQLKELMTLKKN